MTSSAVAGAAASAVAVSMATMKPVFMFIGLLSAVN
jgi:hypothetical protein